MFSLVLALALAVPVAAPLERDAAFQEGVKLYDELEYEQAASRFEQAAKQQPTRGPDRAKVLVYLGLSYAGAGDLDAAKGAFVDAARADRSVVLPVEVSPSLAKLFEDAKASAPVDAAPPQVQTPEASAPEQDGPSPLVPGIGAATGAVLAAGGVGLAVLCAVAYDEAQTAAARDVTQLEAKASLDRANLALTGAGVLIPVGVVVAGVSSFFLLGMSPAGDGAE